MNLAASMVGTAQAGLRTTLQYSYPIVNATRPIALRSVNSRIAFA